MGRLWPIFLQVRSIAFLSSCATLILVAISCRPSGQERKDQSKSVDVRIDTVIVRDTIAVVDTLLVKKVIVKPVAVVDTVIVEKEVVREVELPAEIPQGYVMAWESFLAESTAELADEKICFSGIDSFAVFVSLNEPAKDILSEQRAKEKVELTLRRYDVPLSESSHPLLDFKIEAAWQEDKSAAAFTMSTSLLELLIIRRGNEPYRRMVAIWNDSHYGYVGRKVAREFLLQYLEEKAERVANLYLSAN